jgi:PAS domain S-box-containing protein
MSFMVIVLLMLGGYGLLLWQFHLVHIRGDRSTAVSQELSAVSRFQTDFFRLTARLDELAKSEDIEALKSEAQPLREALQSDIDQTRAVISRLPSDLHSDRTILPTIEAIQSTLPSQLEKVTALAEASDWEAVRLRLANEKKPLESVVSALVRTVERQVSTELSADLKDSAKAQQRILVIVPLTAVFTLLVAAFLGLLVTGSITRPLAKLVTGSRALAKGDFSHRIQLEGDDELATVGDVFNDMIVRLQELYRDVRRNEARWRSVFENSAVGVALTDLNGRFIALNPVFQKMLGYSEEELQTRCFLDITHEAHRENNWAFVEDLLEGKRQNFQVEKQYRRKDGGLVWARSHVSLAPGSERVPRFLMAIIEDVTERKRAEEALQNSQRDLSLMIDAIPGMIHTARPDGYLDYFNQRWLEYVGCSLSDVEGWKWTGWIHPEDLQGIVDKWRACVASGENFEYETRVRRGDGQYRWMLHRKLPLRDETGNIVRWYGTSLDIEDRKRAEAQVEQAYLRLAEAQRLSKTGSFITDLLADDHNWSEETFRIFEFDPFTKVTVQMIRNIVHQEDLPSFDAVIARGMTGNDVDFVFRIVTPRGSVKHIRGMARVMVQTVGRPLFIGALQDVTESKLAEQALDTARSELAHVARVTSLNALTASIAHEINQPLSGIITNASTCLRMLNGEPPNIEGARETARRTIRDGNRAADVITRLRALFSKKEFTLEPLDVNQATREVIALSLSDLQRNRVVLRSELANDLPPVIGDRVQLQQVILNLLRNGSDAMANIEDRARQLLVRTRREGDDRVCLSVQDAGTGINPRDSDKLFEAFYTTKSGGMGIGLSVSRSIIERHHGRLWVEPNDGAGATFSFSVPCEPESTKREAA